MSAAASETPPPGEKQAIALGYEKGIDTAPLVLAKGKGYIAEQIIRLAREHGIEIREDADLATLLSKVDVGEPIPVEAYMAVAEILSYLYRMNQQAKKGGAQ